MNARWKAVTSIAALGAALAGLAGCGGSGGGGGTVRVDVGYQSKTINTVTAGTLLRDLGHLERRLAELGRRNGKTYKVRWYDFATGAPLTAQMIAGKIAIGSMGDYPLLINGSRSAGFDDARSRFVGVTGYNLRGSLNQVVVPRDSTARTLADLRGKAVSTSVGSAAHGMLVRGLRGQGLQPADIEILGQDPSVGVTNVESGKAAALAQFVPYPQQMIFNGKARLLYDGGAIAFPTFHGIVAREKWTRDHPEVLEAFLAATKDTTAHLHRDPLDSARRVARATGLQPEVVYLYNGAGGLVTFDMTIKPQLVDALRKDVPFLKEIGSIKELDVDAFTDDGPLRRAYGPGYDRDAASLTNPAAIKGRDEICDLDVTDPRTASEAWIGEEITPAANPTCLLRLVKKRGGEPRAVYAPSADTGTKLFADAASWVRDPRAEWPLLPFATPEAAAAYVGGHPGAQTLDYRAALAAA
ncbi:ABC transporter substrate-binding protein [Thermomonospora umbrina]|uniref:NitT/TauT family transport system substrate-binding protein n=1 Tax=Thermomonospora umbrina TaxID=111806 RepID=A0A3D9SQX0_9ACTN|nr:ABC transporter substrate-binding protein [Thermomonospora umbrina]REE95325.1 NitT/TauT family transport system substrate-binding protein [Thermomonospora umbrina]